MARLMRRGHRGRATTAPAAPCLPRRFTNPPRSAIDDARRRDRHADPAVTGSYRVTAPVPAGAAPQGVRHWFDLETILELPTPTTSFRLPRPRRSTARLAFGKHPARLSRLGGWEFRALPPAVDP